MKIKNNFDDDLEKTLNMHNVVRIINRIDVSEGIAVNKRIVSKECIIYH